MSGGHKWGAMSGQESRLGGAAWVWVMSGKGRQWQGMSGQEARLGVGHECV